MLVNDPWALAHIKSKSDQRSLLCFALLVFATIIALLCFASICNDHCCICQQLNGELKSVSSKFSLPKIKVCLLKHNIKLYKPTYTVSVISNAFFFLPKMRNEEFAHILCWHKGAAVSLSRLKTIPYTQSWLSLIGPPLATYCKRKI